MHHDNRQLAAGFVTVAAALVVLLAALLVDARVVAPFDQQSGVGASAEPVKELWKTRVGDLIRVWTNSPYLDSSTNRLFVNAAGNFSILDASSGAVIKSVRTRSQHGQSDVVPVAGTMVCANEYNYTTCRSKTTLATIWEFGVEGEFGTMPLYVSSKNVMYVANGGNSKMYKLNAKTGALQATSAKLPGYKLSSEHPSFSKKHNLVLDGDANFVIALDADTLSLAWMYPTDSQVGTAAVFSEDESTVYYGSAGSFGKSGSLFALQTASGALVWQFKVPVVNSGCANAPSLHNDVIYLGAFGTFNSDCYALHAATGKQIWNVKTDFGVDSGHSYIYGDTVLFPNLQGIFAVALNGSGVAWTWTGALGPVYNFPAPTADGKMYFTAQHGYVYALQLPSK